MNTLHALLDRLWEDYAATNPQARRIHALLEARGEAVLNDHIALRSFGVAPVDIDTLAAPFQNFGYEPADHYTFPDKHLRARYYEHPDAALPKVFISELHLPEFTDALVTLVTGLAAQVDPALAEGWDYPVSGRPWDLPYANYERLASESEYAAWVATMGLRANHFTVSVNALHTFEDLAGLNAFLKEHGFKLNTSGGEIKGNPEQYLEQSSTLASEIDVDFTDGAHTVPGCYYEFAKRYPLPNGRLFQGFVPASANRIFESTNRAV